VENIDPATFTPADSPLSVADVMTSPVYRDLSTPIISPGDPAFDFELHRLDVAGETVRLSAFVGQRPVALIFGSYT
jgi:hypothetical protein